MRDLVLTTIIFGLIPFILRSPFIGMLAWVWLGIMNPHRFTWGWAYNLPFSQIVALCFFIALLLNRDKLHRFPANGATVVLVMFVAWLGMSPLFSFHPELEMQYWLRAFKIQLMVLLAFLVVGNRDQIHKLTWVLALSIGFYGIKGGLFTLATGGGNRVFGPAGSFIEDNNTLALAIIMAIPLFRYLQLQAENVWVRRGCIAAMGLCAVSALGSQSRGAFLALLAMGVFLWLKSRNKAFVSILLLVLAPLMVMFMPESWTERMSTIQTYDQDASAMGRINAWWMAWNLAVDRFPIGGGFAIYTRDVYQLYAPDPSIVLAAHSIYFQILGEHGFVGLFLFLMVFWLAWRYGSWVLCKVAGRGDLLWARDLASMAQVSLVGYAVGGAFLSLTYFDLPYYIVVLLVVLRVVVARELATPAVQPIAPQTTPAALQGRAAT
jgi:probable O-glycosylation ligase (exosortase A-associated)